MVTLVTLPIITAVGPDITEDGSLGESASVINWFIGDEHKTALKEIQQATKRLRQNVCNHDHEVHVKFRKIIIWNDSDNEKKEGRCRESKLFTNNNNQCLESNHFRTI